MLNTVAFRPFVILLLAFLVTSLGLEAEVKISVTITGELDEMLPILLQLKETAKLVESGQSDEMRVQVHSVISDTDAEQPLSHDNEKIQPEKTVPSAPTLSPPQVSPESVKAGEGVILAVRVNDPNNVVDTISAEVLLPEPVTVDLFDKGEQGDEVAGDNIWSCLFTLPTSLPVGSYQVKISAFDANGEPIQSTANDGTQTLLSSSGVLTVVP